MGREEQWRAWLCRRGLRGATGRGEGTLILAGSQIAPPAGPRAVGRRRQQQGWRSNLAACFHSTPPTPTPTQTSHWGRQITACPPCLDPEEIWEKQLLRRRRRMSTTERPPGGQACVAGTQQQLGNMSSTSDILSLTLLGGVGGVLRMRL